MKRATIVLVAFCSLIAGEMAARLPLVAGGGAPAAQAPIFRSGVDLVEVAVLVRDRDGRLIADLGQDDFQILEDGVPQTIVAFERVSVPVFRAADAAPVFAVPRDVASNEHVADSRIYVLLLDTLHVAPQRTLAVRNRAREFIEQHVGPTDLVAVVSPGGLERATQDFTSDKARMLAAVDQFAGVKVKSAALERDEISRTAAAEMYQGRDPSDGERAGRMRSLAGVLEALARHLDRVERRRKAVLLFSEGVDYNLTDVMGQLQRYSMEVTREMERAVSALMRANVSLYAIDPRGLSAAEGDLYEEAPSLNAVVSQGPHAEHATSIRSLRALSEPTGGFAAVDRNEFRGAFERIVDESSDYYVLGYSPVKPAKPGEFRELGVRVFRPGVRVTARKGYRAPAAARQLSVRQGSADPELPGPPRRPAGGRVEISPGEIAAPAVAASGRTTDLQRLLASPLPLAGLPMRVQATPLGADGKRTRVQIVVEILGGSLRFTERAGRLEERVDIALLTLDERARAANGRSAALDLRLTPEQYEGVRHTGVRWLSRLELTPGRYQVRVAASAAGTGRTGLVTYDLDVPRFDAGRVSLGGVTLTSLTSVLMVTRSDTPPPTRLPSPPSAARTFVAGDRITAAAELYVPASLRADVSVAAEVERAGGSAKLPVGTEVVTGRGQPHREELIFEIDTALLAPGPYVLRLVVDSAAGGPDRFERAVPFDITRR